MEMMLAENIRAFRKQRMMTQEQLAEVLGVTPGAVYKWEAKLSVPELPMIVELADFFDSSVDALLGYELKDNRLEATIKRLKQCRHEKDRFGLAEAEKALKKYPNTFALVHESAALYQAFGTISKEKGLLLRALELLEKSLLLLAQNTDPEIGELTIYGDMANIYEQLGDQEKALDLLNKNNMGGYYNDLIGLALVDGGKRFEEAVPYLSEALLTHVAALIHTIIGFVNVYLNRRDHRSAQAILLWGIGMLSGLRKGDRPNYLDKVNSVFYTCLANTQLKMGDAYAARVSLKTAGTIAKAFDAAPDYDGCALRFVDHFERISAYDNLGTTAAEAVRNAIAALEDETLSALWKEVVEQDKIEEKEVRQHE